MRLNSPSLHSAIFNKQEIGKPENADFARCFRSRCGLPARLTYARFFARKIDDCKTAVRREKKYKNCAAFCA